MTVFERRSDRVLVLLGSGNLAGTRAGGACPSNAGLAKVYLPG
jgi:hypothetical protein